MDGLGYSINLLIFREILQEISLRKTSAIITWNGGPGPKTTRSVFSGRENNLTMKNFLHKRILPENHRGTVHLHSLKLTVRTWK